MTSTLVGVANLALGLLYASYGLMTIADLRRNWAQRGVSHFGLAWVAMAFTCGPHHIEHGLHVLTTAQVGRALDLAAVLVGLPAAAVWFCLRVEALRGGRGDRPIHGTPRWVEALPTVGAMYLFALLTAAFAVAGTAATFDVRLIPNLLLVGLYVAVGAVIARAQLRNHRLTGGWSLSGISLAAVFPTCALMHGTWILYVSTGQYLIDWHLLVIDMLSVPAAIYFLWVVSSISSGRIEDWSSGAADARSVPAEPVAHL